MSTLRVHRTQHTPENSTAIPTTLLYHSAIRELGLTNGYVLCLVYRYCQMRRGVFSVGIENKASELEKISHTRLRRAIHKLRDAGYIEDLTPGVNRSHDYVITEKGLALLTENGRYSLEVEDSEG